MAIVLIGPPAVGKTLLGGLVAKRLRVVFNDTDFLVEKFFGPVKELLLTCESQFRDAESICLRNALSRGGVVATGAGCVQRKENQRYISRHLVIFLRTSCDNVAPRLCFDTRPVTGDIESWIAVYNKRKDIYSKLADIEFDVNKSSPISLADQLVRFIYNRSWHREF